MADRVELAFRDAAARLVPDDRPTLAAVSGGGDSIALLHLLTRRCRTDPPAVVVAHLDHGLRRGSVADRRFVESTARTLRLTCVADRRPVATLRRPDESLEEAARRVRRAFLLEVAREQGCARVALGHTLDDQAETVLLRWLRGAGPRALAGMAESGPGPFVRPLLAVERHDVRRYLERRGFAWREDPTNRDERFDRNRLRRRILPVLQATANPRAAQALVRGADRIREDAELLDRWAVRRTRRWSRRTRGGEIEIDAVRLAAAEPPIARRVAREVLRMAGVSEKAASARLVEALLDLARGGQGRGRDLPAGIRATRHRDRIRITVAETDVDDS